MPNNTCNLHFKGDVLTFGLLFVRTGRPCMCTQNPLLCVQIALFNPVIPIETSHYVLLKPCPHLLKVFIKVFCHLEIKIRSEIKWLLTTGCLVYVKM